MADAQKTRNNHWVPQFYLKQWSNNGSSVLCYDTVVRNAGCKLWRSGAVKGICCWRDFYTQHQDAQIDDSVESFIEREYETPAKPCFDKLRSNEKLSDEDRDRLVEFAIVQMVRTPSWYRKICDITTNKFSEVLESSVLQAREDFAAGRPLPDRAVSDSPYECGDSPFPPIPIDTRYDECREGFVASIDVDRKNYLSSIGHVLKGPIAKTMREHAWSIVSMPDGFELPTSDVPFVRLANYGLDGFSLDAGVGVNGVDLFMPLTPRHLLITEVGYLGETPDDLLYDESKRRLIIRAIVENASRYIICREESDEVVSLRPRLVDPDCVDRMNFTMQNWDSIQTEGLNDAPVYSIEPF